MSEPVAHINREDRDDAIAGELSGGVLIWSRSPDKEFTVPLYTDDALREAVEAEREACAKVCDDAYEASASRDDGENDCEVGIKECARLTAAAIRARGAA